MKSNASPQLENYEWSADKSISAELDNADVSQTLINYSDLTA